jgi:hypothetical protein
MRGLACYYKPFQFTTICYARKLFIENLWIIIVESPYEFLVDLSRLKAEFARYKSIAWLINAVVVSIAIYAAFILLGVPAFTRFYWEDVFFLAQLPAILSMLLGALVATLIGRRNKSDIYDLLDPELSEKTRTAYDNKDTITLPMQRLAIEVRAMLANVRSSQILNWRSIYIRMGLGALLLGAVFFIMQSQIGADISPADIQSISNLKDKALGIFQDEQSAKNAAKVNLSGNIYGKPSLAILSETKLQLQLYPGMGVGSMAVSSNPENRLFQQSSPGEAKAVPAELYIESLPAENREIIKRYFSNLPNVIS